MIPTYFITSPASCLTSASKLLQRIGDLHAEFVCLTPPTPGCSLSLFSLMHDHLWLLTTVVGGQRCMQCEELTKLVTSTTMREEYEEAKV